MLWIFIWVMLYGGTYTISKLISQTFCIGQWGITFAMLLYVCLFLTWIYITGRSREIGLCTMKSTKRMEDLHMIILLVLPVFNIICERGIKIAFSTIVYMISISITEEIFFRGFLLRYLLKRSMLYGIVISSVIFAVFHVVNLFQYKYNVYILLQVFCAFVVSICYSAITIQYNSLFPCFIAHALTNIMGSRDFTTSNVFCGNMMGLWICIVIYACYGIFLCRKNELIIIKERKL